jgi:hypothetical protein
MTTSTVLDGLTAQQILTAASISQGNQRVITMTAANGGSVLPTGVLGYLTVPFAGTISAAYLFADEVGSVVVDIWKTGYSSAPPTVSNTIAASDLPTLSSAQKYSDTTLTGWTTTVSVGDVFAFNINSVTSLKTLTVQLIVTTT